MYPTNFNDKLRLVLEHATGKDILAVLTNSQQMVTTNQQAAVTRVLNGDKKAAPGEVADMAAVNMHLSFMLDSLCALVSNRMTEAEAKAEKERKASGVDKLPSAVSSAL